MSNRSCEAAILLRHIVRRDPLAPFISALQNQPLCREHEQRDCHKRCHRGKGIQLGGVQRVLMEAQGKGGAGRSDRAGRGNEHGTANHRVDRNQREHDEQKRRHKEQLGSGNEIELPVPEHAQKIGLCDRDTGYEHGERRVHTGDIVHRVEQQIRDVDPAEKEHHAEDAGKDHGGEQTLFQFL